MNSSRRDSISIVEHDSLAIVWLVYARNSQKIVFFFSYHRYTYFNTYEGKGISFSASETYVVSLYPVFTRTNSLMLRGYF